MSVPPLTTAAADVLRICGALGLRACLIGGIAVQRWGQPRATQDVDATVLAPFGSEPAVVDRLLSRLTPRVADARPFALERRVLLVQADNGIKVDISLAGSPFEEQVLERSTVWRHVGDVALLTCSAEDLIIYKLVAARPQDLVDVAGIVRRQGTRLDADRVRLWGREFAELKEDPDMLRPFEAALRQRNQV
jgi:hypothetical protein